MTAQNASIFACYSATASQSCRRHLKRCYGKFCKTGLNLTARFDRGVSISGGIMFRCIGGGSRKCSALSPFTSQKRRKCVATEIRRQMSEIRKRLSQVKEQNLSVGSNADQKSEGRVQMSEVSGLNSMISE